MRDRELHLYVFASECRCGDYGGWFYGRKLYFEGLFGSACYWYVAFSLSMSLGDWIMVWGGLEGRYWEGMGMGVMGK